MKDAMRYLMLTGAVLALTAGAANAADGYDGYNSNNHDSWYNWNNNVYLSLGAGWNYQNSQEFKAIGRDKVDFDSGWLGEVAVGHTWLNSRFGDTRTEIEGSYRENGVNSIKGTGGSGDRGEFYSWDAMLNEYYDFHTGTAFTPYVGAGVGAAFETARHIGPAFAPGGAGISDSDTQFAYQGIVGVDYWTTKRSAWGLRYDYLGTSRGKFDSTVGGTARNEGTNNHAVLVTYRYNWGTEPAPMAEPRPMTPAPMVQQTTQTTTIAAPTEQQIEDSPYKIFFANDSVKLTNNAQQVIADAATAAGAQHAVVLQLTSNTDTTGSKQLNDHLSEKRAKAVRSALIAQGVTPDKISIISNAERDLPVPTGPNVKEPRNRVVTIVLQ